MKTIFFLTLLALSIITFSQRDDDDADKQLGILAGWNYSNIQAKGIESSNAHGFYGGIIWEQKVVPTFRVQSGVLFIQNGFSSSLLPDLDYTTLNYLTIPMIAKLKVGPVYALGGITSGFRVGGSDTFKDGTSNNVDKNEYKGYDFGAQLGLGFQFLIIGFEARYTWGLTDISKGDAIDMNNQAFSLGAHLHLF